MSLFDTVKERQFQLMVECSSSRGEAECWAQAMCEMIEASTEESIEVHAKSFEMLKIMIYELENKFEKVEQKLIGLGQPFTAIKKPLGSAPYIAESFISEGGPVAIPKKPGRPPKHG